MITYRPQWWISLFGIKKPPYKKKESDWNPIWTKNIYYVFVCQHGISRDVHCCNCHPGIKYEGMICRCVGGD